MTDLLLAFGHHALVFSLVALLAAELALLARPVAGAEIRLLSTLDAAYGLTAGLIILIGFSRVFLGAKGSAFFLHNPLFWAKLLFFLAVGLASAVPTVRFMRWKRAALADASYAPAPADVASVRRWMIAELALFVPIPLLAAAMVRGVGL